jgi:chromosome segregation ATPase
MSEPAELERRVSRLETEMSEVCHLARGASWEVGALRADLRSHTRVLNALRQTQVDQGEEMRTGFARVDGELDDLRAEVGDLRAEVREGFSVLAVGQAQITALLTTRQGEPEES